MNKIGTVLRSRGRLIVAILALAAAFALSIKFGDRGVQFDLEQTPLKASESAGDGDYKLSELKILNRSLLQIKDSYVEPDRIEPGEMLVAALDKVQNELPAVVVDYKPDEKDPASVDVKVVEQEKNFELDKLESLWEMSFRLKEIFQFIQQHTAPEDDKTFKDIEYAAVNGMLTTLDPHSNLLTPEHYEEMQTQTGGEFGGLGIVISIRDGQLTVISPIDGTPAAAKGIQSRDKIVRIEDESTVNMNLNEAVNMLRGEPGSKVDIWVSRKGWGEPRKFTIERDKIPIESVNREPLGDKIGYIRIKNFQANTVSDLKENLKKLKEKMGGIQGLVLDLRDNPGGLLDQAIKVADLFLEDGTVVTTVGAGNKIRDEKVATKSGTEPDYPITVLVNAGSASASEIVSGALQNHDRALVLGDTTFGKGTVQVLYEFPDTSALKLTVAQYLTPGGVSIQSRGITPDLRLIPAVADDEQVNLFLSDNILREGDLESHLSRKAAGVAENEGVVFLRYLKERRGEEEDEFRDPNAFREDFQINLSQKLLTSTGAEAKRNEMLEQLQPELEEIYSEQLGKIQKKLEGYDVDWSAGPSPDEPEFGFEVETLDAEEPIQAGDEIKLKATLTNESDAPVHRMKAITSSAHDAVDDREFLFGRVEPGGSKSWTVDVNVPEDTDTRHELVKFELSNDDENFGEPRTETVEIDALPRPRFAFNYEIDDDNGDGIFQKGEEVTFRVHVRNVGGADAGETLAYLKDRADNSIYLEEGRITLEEIPKGESRTATFEFRIKEKPEQSYVGLELDVYDQTFREFVQKNVEVPFSTEDPEVADAPGRVEVTQGPAKLFASASSDGSVVARVESGTQLPALVEVGGWRKVDLGRQTGWIKNSYVDFTQGAETDLPQSGVAWSNFESPRIQVTPKQRITDAETVDLTGTISDNQSVRDYYVFVYHREDASKVNSRKLLYRRVGEASTELDAPIRLFEGMNRISLVARDDEEMSMQETVYVYRK